MRSVRGMITCQGDVFFIVCVNMPTTMCTIPKPKPFSTILNALNIAEVTAV